MTETGDKETLLLELEASLAAGTFVRLTLGKFRGGGEAQKLVVTRVVIKEASQLKLVTSFSRKDVTETLTFADGRARIATLVGEAYLSATLFTTAEDVTLTYSKKKATQLTRAKPTFSALPASADHNRAKQYIVDPARPYLKDLGISLEDGRVKPSMYAKYKQICHFIGIADGLIRESDVSKAKSLSVIDIGAGKGYLTFALYDHITTTLGLQAHITGIEVRPDLVTFCTGIARKAGFKGLAFEAAIAGGTKARALDIMIALHACDTATDDAIFQGIAANAGLIITAPCCQHELAPQLSRPGAAIEGLMKFGLFKQRQADLVTDAARCLLLEAHGYKVKVIEFVSTEHTAKNLLIAGIRSSQIDRAAARRQYDALKAFAGFKTQHLETRLAGLATGTDPGVLPSRIKQQP